MELPRRPRPGVEQWQNARNGLLVVRLHYSADPRKRTPEWKAEASANMHPRSWRREYEIDWASPEGDPVIPEFREDLHVRDFAWDRSLRLLRFWDFGYVSPVVLFAQLTFFGQLRVRRELAPFNTPLRQLLESMRAVTLELSGRSIPDPTDAYDVGGAEVEDKGAFDAGDPAGVNQTDLGSSAEVLGDAGIIIHTTRPGTELSYANLRDRFLRNVVDPNEGPVPAILIHPDCPALRAACAGAFHLAALPPYKPVKTHPEKDLVDALRYGEDNIRALIPTTTHRLHAMATSEIREFRADTEPVERTDWAARQGRLWRDLVEGM